MALFDKNSMKKLEKEMQTKLDKESRKVNYSSNDSQSEIERKPKGQMKASGVTANALAIRKPAKEIYDKLQKGK